MTDIQEVYTEDTVGRKYHTPIVSKNNKKWQNKDVVQLPPQTISLKYPMTRQEFKKLSDTLKVEYIKYLHEEYSATASHIAKMLGYTSHYFVTKVIDALGLSHLFKRGGRMSNAKKVRWEQFLVASPRITGEPAVEPIQSKNREVRTNTKPMLCQNLNFTMAGKLHTSDIIDSISTMVPEGTECQVYVTIEISKEVSL